MGLCRRGLRAVATLRQSSLGPTLGAKGGGAGGGRATVEPLAEALLGLGADLFAVESATNLLAAHLDDLLRRGAADLEPSSVTWRRALDMDDRAVREVTVGSGGVTRASGFDITAASEVMAVLSLAVDRADLRRRLGAIVVGTDRAGRPVTAEDLGTAGAMAVLLRDALCPNLLVSAEGTPVFLHGGPFANIAHGCSSVVADRIALAHADVVVTEAGFGADLGAEKLVHLKAPVLGRSPDVAVLVVTVRAVADHDARAGAGAGHANVAHHVGVLRSYGLPVVVTVNRFPDDTPAAVEAVVAAARAAGAADAVAHDAFARGGAGAEALAEAVLGATDRPATVHPLVRADLPVRDKLEVIARRVYGAGAVTWSPAADAAMARLEAAGFGSLGVCVAKTQRSLSADPERAGAPSGFVLPVREVRLAAGAGFVTVLTGDIVTMPGLPARPRFLELDLTADGEVVGLA
jgi:formate--tetrahydrofolate ligase